ncbi:MAG: transporter substrate-binding domain-containing protein [Patescibacteria group bacterium]|nr:transporter substrate-binding domain-containing protein [Patescibacteria group bacterium]
MEQTTTKQENMASTPRKKRWLVWAALAIILIVGIAVFYPRATNKRAYLASGHPEWPPIMWQDGEQITGVGAELIAMIARDLGFKIETKYAGLWDEVQQKAKDGRVDVLVAAYKTAERETYMDYSIAYTQDPIAIYVKKGANFPYSVWGDLAGKKGVLTIGDSYGQSLDDYIKEQLTTVRVNTTNEAFEMLKQGQADYFIYALYSGEKSLAENNLANEIEILPIYAASEDFFLTISKKSPLVEYLPALNARIEQYKSDGTIERLIAKYRASYLR